MSKPFKWTPVVRQLLSAKEYVSAIHPGPLSEDRTPLTPLGTVCSAAIPYPPEALASRIEKSCANDTWFLCDACVFIHSMSDRVWEAIFEKHVAVTRGVKNELTSWLNAPTNNRLAHAAYDKMIRGDTSSPISLMSFGKPDEDQTLIDIMKHYVNILIGRKLLAGMVAGELARELNRTPKLSEVESRLKKEFGERGYQIAIKYSSNSKIENLYSDEELVVAAFLWALISGKAVIILTRDQDVQDQFFKMHSLLIWQYHAMLVAERYAASPESFKCEPIAPNDSRFERVFTGSDNTLIDCPPELMRSVLPSQFAMFPVYCWLLSGPDDNLRISQSICTCESGFGQLFSIKAQTGGLNTDKLSGKNLHVRLPGTSIGGHWGAIATDKVVPNLNISLTDVYMALRNDEEYTRIVWR